VQQTASLQPGVPWGLLHAPVAFSQPPLTGATVMSMVPAPASAFQPPMRM